MSTTRYPQMYPQNGPAVSERQRTLANEKAAPKCKKPRLAGLYEDFHELERTLAEKYVAERASSKRKANFAPSTIN